MTLRCEYGGRVIIGDGSDPDPDTRQHWELYRCQECGRTGTYRFGPINEALTGCLTVDDSSPAVPVGR